MLIKYKFKRGDEVVLISSIPSLALKRGDTFVIEKMGHWIYKSRSTNVYFAKGDSLPSAPENYLQLVIKNQ